MLFGLVQRKGVLQIPHKAAGNDLDLLIFCFILRWETHYPESKSIYILFWGGGRVLKQI